MNEIRQTIEPLAGELGVKPLALQKWWQRGHVPHRWRLPLLQLAEKRGVVIRIEDFDFGAR